MKSGKMIFILICFLCSISHSNSQYDAGLPPSITRGPGTEYFYNPILDNMYGNKVLSMICEAEGSPIGRYTWRKNGELIECADSDAYFCVNDTIVSITPGYLPLHQGYYQCTVTNYYGSTMSDNFRVRMYNNGIGDTTVTYRNLDINSDQTLACYYASVSTPSLEEKWSNPDAVNPKISWGTATGESDRYPVKIKSSSRVQIHARTGDIYFANILSTDEKFYKCIISADRLDTLTGYHAVTLQNGIPENFAPYLMASTQIPDVGLEGSSVIFQCLFAGRPTPLLSSANWRRVDGIFETSKVTFSDYFTKMRISNLQPSDAGTYKCDLPGFPGSGHTFDLEIAAAPRFNSHEDMPYSRNVSEGETVQINCNPYAVPQASVRWYKNGEALNPSLLPPKFTLNANQTQLTIFNVCRECADGSSDVMSLQCNVSNEHGFKFVQGYLNIPGLIESPVNGTLLCYDCEGNAESSCAVSTVNTDETMTRYCNSGACATSTLKSNDGTISKVTRGCSESQSVSTNCVSYGSEKLCITTCIGSYCNGDIILSTV